MRNKLIELAFIAFAMVVQLLPLKAQTQEIDLSGKWGFQTDGFPAGFAGCSLYASFARINCAAGNHG